MNAPRVDARRSAVDRQVAENRGRSTLLLVACAIPIAFVLIVVNLLVGGGWIGLVIVAVVLSPVLALVATTADAVALRSSRAVPAEGPDSARYHNLVEGLCVSAGLPEPRLFVVSDDAQNAFVVGRVPKQASLVVTTGLLERASRVELEGTIAHELYLIQSRATAPAMLAVMVIGIPTRLAEAALGLRTRRDGKDRLPTLLALTGFVFVPFLPLLGRMLRFAVPESNSQVADLAAVELTRYPPGLLGALESIRADPRDTRAADRATAHLWFVAPDLHTSQERGPSKFERRFDTHLPLDVRIEGLREL